MVGGGRSKVDASSGSYGEKKRETQPNSNSPTPNANVTHLKALLVPEELRARIEPEDDL